MKDQHRDHLQGRSEWVTTRDGRRLHAMVLPGPGPHAPTVVFEAGAAATRSSWALVQPAVGTFARAIVYDRCGLGRSAADLTSRTLRRMADDLTDLLDHFGPGPFILVGHSAGGPIVRLAAAVDPSRIAGLVLVDPSDEASDLLLGSAFRRFERAAIQINLLLARTRLFRLAYRSTIRPLPEDARRDMEREGFTIGVVRTHAAQARTFLDELATRRVTPPGLGEIPGHRRLRRACRRRDARSRPRRRQCLPCSPRRPVRERPPRHRRTFRPLCASHRTRRHHRGDPSPQRGVTGSVATVMATSTVVSPAEKRTTLPSA